MFFAVPLLFSLNSEERVMRMIRKLRRIKVLDSVINQKIAESERLKRQIRNVTDESVIDNIRILENEINADVDAFVDLKRDCMNFIDTLDDVLLVGILYKRYFESKTWETIADELNVSRQWVTKKHKEFVACSLHSE